MTASGLVFVNTIISAVNLIALLSIAFFGGRWTGRVEVRLEHLEKIEKAHG